VKIENSSGTGVEDTAECDGSDSDIVADLSCSFTMATLLSSPYSLSVGDSIIATVEAMNNYGYGAASPASNGALLVQTEPATPAAPTRDSATTKDSLVIDWVAPTTNGASILSYNLYWDAGTNGATFTSLRGLLTDYTGLTHTQTSSVDIGDSYQFKVRAKNIWGWSAFSPVLTVVAAHKPDTMATVTTSIVSSTGAVRITWTAPESNGDAITEYKILIGDSTGTTYTESSDCDGSNSAVITALSCTVDMSSLAAIPYSYTTQGTLIRVRATASNDYGESSESTENTSGATYRTVPAAMSAPVRDSSSTSSQIILTWTAPSTSAETGGSAITAYELLWDAGDGATPDTVLIALASLST
jgi:large repetitive protein